MQRILLVLLLFIPVFAFAQFPVEGVVLDKQSSKPLPFTSIAIKGIPRGTISNEDGFFRLQRVEIGDTLLFSYLGYVKKILIIDSENDTLRIELVPQVLSLSTFTIAADSDPYFDILFKCRKELLKYSKHRCKAYLEMHTDVMDKPGEVIELYYNADVRMGNLYGLNYKSGRQALAKVDNSYFLSLSTTGIFQRFKLVEGDFDMPTTPLELSKGKMKKLFDLSLISSGDDDPYFHILFKPKKDEQKIFEGEIWIDKTTYRPIEVKLHIENALIKPFIPIFPSDSLGQIEMNISQRFQSIDGDIVPSLLRFDYAFNSYIPIDKKKPIGQNNLAKIKPVRSDGILYYYSYDKPFIDPIFDYRVELNDYQKIQNTPYHAAFWDLSEVLIQSERMEESLKFFEEHGRLHNHSDLVKKDWFDGIGNNMDHTNPFWTDTMRLRFDETFKEKIEAQQFESRYVIPDRAKYDLDVEIYLDIVETQDTLVQYSETVFDIFESYYNLPNDSLTNTFINIYFDLAEIARRKMEMEIDQLEILSPEVIIDIHEKTMNELRTSWEVYLDESVSGSSYPVLFEYNQLIKEELGVDNFKLFNLDEPIGQGRTIRPGQ